MQNNLNVKNSRIFIRHFPQFATVFYKTVAFTLTLCYHYLNKMNRYNALLFLFSKHLLLSRVN